MVIIDYKNVEIRQASMVVLESATFTINEGEFVYLIGKVGSGKSSLLKTMYGELEVICDPHNAHANILGYDLTRLKRKQIPALRRAEGIVFQDFQLLTDRSVFDNLSFVLKSTGWKDKKLISHRIMEVLDLVGMETKGYKMPHELSGGEQQRICIARALLNNPKLILADEPTGNLDPETGHFILEILHKVCKSGTTIIMITHNLQWLEEFPGRVFTCKERRLETDSVKNGGSGAEAQESIGVQDNAEDIQAQDSMETKDGVAAPESVETPKEEKEEETDNHNIKA